MQPRQFRRGWIVSQHGCLVGWIRVADSRAHEKAIELGFGQRIGTVVLHWILRGDDEVGFGQRVRHAVDGDSRFSHRFQKRRLCLRAGAVDLVREHHVGEDRPRLKCEATGGRTVSRLGNRGSEDIARQEIAGELDSAEAAVDAAGQRLGERRLADARYVFQQQMPARDQGFDGPADDLGLAPKRPFDVVADRRDQRRGLLGVETGDRIVVGLRRQAFVGHAGSSVHLFACLRGTPSGGAFEHGILGCRPAAPVVSRRAGPRGGSSSPRRP